LGTSAAERLNEVREARSYHLEFEEDGSFRAEDVPPGNYELRIKVTKPKPGPDPYLHEGEELGSLVQTVTIPKGKGPYDLGQRIVSVKGETGGAVALPLDASLTTLEGQTLQIASLRGKYVVLVFWASWSEPSKQALAALQKIRAGFPAETRVQFIATSVDDDAESMRQNATAVGDGFTWTRLSTTERASVTESFNVATLPAVFLLGPDGRIYARDLNAERLKATLLRLLPQR
jgi:peroxiredoxin